MTTTDGVVQLTYAADRPDAARAGASGSNGSPGSTDAGSSNDAGAVETSASIDSNSIDAGPIDAGPIDAGPIDAGPIDAGASVGTPIDAPTSLPWREATLTRAKELECLAYALTRGETSVFKAHLLTAIDQHLRAARQAARHSGRRRGRRMDDALLERAVSNLDAAAADLLQLAPTSYVLGQIPSLLNEVQRHLPRHDPRRQEFERIAMQLGVHPPDRPPAPGTPALTGSEKKAMIEADRSRIVSIARGANTAGLREQLRVRSFRTVLVISAGVMTLLAVLLGLLGWVSPATLPLCFQPEQGGQIVVICPTGQSGAVPVIRAGGPAQPQIDAW